MKFKTVVLCLKLLTCLIVQRSFGNIYIYIYTEFLEVAIERKLTWIGFNR